MRFAVILMSVSPYMAANPWCAQHLTTPSMHFFAHYQYRPSSHARSMSQDKGTFVRMKCLILLLACGAVGWAQRCDPELGAENLARSGAASQSSTYGITPIPEAGKAIDGITRTNFHDHSCTHTSNDRPAWWKLDLKRRVKVKSVVIVNRQDCCPERLIRAQVMIGNSADGNNPICGTITDVSKASITLCCDGMEGRYLSVTISDRAEYLTLCEVEVYEEDMKKEPVPCWE
uniref:Fucolectin tachylectin-4 pentraxin-1 domain-containing protein n=1 Tax=Leptobrachium leishanense TaxID=445787 RepID=A0A8C5PRP0_9ANUR